MSRLDGFKIAVIDDDPDVLESIELAMRAEGALTAVAEDGTAAVSVCQNFKPDAVILDMMLPKRSGFLVLEELTAMDPTPIVLMVTANEGKRHMAYALSLGVSEYFNKPVSLERLIDRVAALLNSTTKEEDE